MISVRYGPGDFHQHTARRSVHLLFLSMSHVFVMICLFLSISVTADALNNPITPSDGNPQTGTTDSAQLDNTPSKRDAA